MSFVITLDLTQITMIIAIPSLIIFFCALALNLSDVIGSFFKSIYIQRILDENRELVEEHQKWRKEFEKRDV